METSGTQKTNLFLNDDIFLGIFTKISLQELLNVRLVCPILFAATLLNSCLLGV